MIKTKVAFLEDWLFSSQSGLFENFRLDTNFNPPASNISSTQKSGQE